MLVLCFQNMLRLAYLFFNRQSKFIADPILFFLLIVHEYQGNAAIKTPSRGTKWRSCLTQIRTTRGTKRRSCLTQIRTTQTPVMKPQTHEQGRTEQKNHIGISLDISFESSVFRDRSWPFLDIAIFIYNQISIARTPMARSSWLIRTRLRVPTKFFR